jgi:hypothetical protein
VKILLAAISEFDNLQSPENDGGLSPEIGRMKSFALRSGMMYEKITR